MALFRGGTWLIDTDRNYGTAERTFDFGYAGSKPAAGDFNGDKLADVAYVNDVEWNVDTNFDQVVDQQVRFGLPTDIAMSGNFDHATDNRYDFVVYRGGTFFGDTDHAGGAGESTVAFGGAAGDLPVVVAPLGGPAPKFKVIPPSRGAPGAYDASFNGTGKLITTVTGPYVNFPIAITRSQHILGFEAPVGGGAANRIIARLFGRAVDAGFGSAGSVVETQANPLHIFQHPLNDKFLVVYRHSSMIKRFNENGSLDTTYGSGGEANLRDLVRPGAGRIEDAAIRPDGKLVLVGNFNGSMGSDVLMLNDDGSVDRNFDVGPLFEAASVAIQPDWRIVVAGSFHLTRFHANGQRDTGFGSAGFNSFNIPENTAITWPTIHDLAIDDRGQITGLIDILMDPFITQTYVLLRLDHKGQKNLSFGSSGTGYYIAAPMTGLANVSYSKYLAVQHDNKIIVSGSLPRGSYAYISRHLETGGPDAGFAAGGLFQYRGPFLGTEDYGLAIDDKTGDIMMSGVDWQTLTCGFTPCGSNHQLFLLRVLH